MAFWPEYFNDQSRDSEENPLKYDPPPSYEYPPTSAMMPVPQLSFCNHLDANVLAITLRANQFLSLLLLPLIL